eukprot:m51a1_g12138 hypothetical protein (126) ;mRNA; f:4578-5023
MEAAQKRSVWVKYEEPNAPPADAEEVYLDAEVLGVNRLKALLTAQLGIPYRARDVFLALPECAECAAPELGAYLSKDTGALDPQKELDPDFFQHLGKGILRVRVRPGAVPLATQPPGNPFPTRLR